MEQRIAFCKTSDDVSIAYAIVDNQGPPVIYVAGFPAHLEAEWQEPSSRQFLSTLAAGLTLVRYDMRGCGLSDRDVEDVSIGVLVKDLEAVTDASGFGTFALLGLGMLAGPIALTYAAAHPERISQVVLCSAFAEGNRLASAEDQRMLVEYTAKFGVPVLEYVESTDRSLQLDRTGRDVVQLAATSALQASLLRTFYSIDVSDLLERVTMPATILHGKGDRLVPFSEGRRLAATLPRAEFVPLSGNTGAALTEQSATLPAIRRALGVSLPSGDASASGMVVVLFTDIVGHTEMMQRLGDARGRDVLRDHERITRDLLKQHGGTEVKTMGDGFMASFGSVTSAMECAIALQRAFAAHTEAMPEPLHVRVGLNAGEPIEEDGDLFGATVILASRIAAKALAGEILVPDTVRGLLSGKGFVFGDRGEFVPKGFDESVRLWNVRWRDQLS
jgi:class 3 adenylate cyclase